MPVTASIAPPSVLCIDQLAEHDTPCASELCLGAGSTLQTPHMGLGDRLGGDHILGGLLGLGSGILLLGLALGALPPLAVQHFLHHVLRRAQLGQHALQQAAPGSAGSTRGTQPLSQGPTLFLSRPALHRVLCSADLKWPSEAHLLGHMQPPPSSEQPGCAS